MKAVELKINGIKCDNPACGWSDMNASLDPARWLNHPCPSCGSNLLTEADYRAYKAATRTITILNVINYPFMLFARLRGRPARYTIRKVKMDGTGIIKLEDE